MNLLKLIGLTLIHLIRQVWELPRTISDAIKLRQQRRVSDEFEAERLDRIRNPSKYLGK